MDNEKWLWTHKSAKYVLCLFCSKNLVYWEFLSLFIFLKEPGFYILFCTRPNGAIIWFKLLKGLVNLLSSSKIYTKNIYFSCQMLKTCFFYNAKKKCKMIFVLFFVFMLNMVFLKIKTKLYKEVYFLCFFLLSLTIM